MLVSLGLLAVAASGGEGSDRLALHVSFDAGLTAQGALETIGEPRLVAGRSGQALKLRNGRDAVAFRLPPDFNPAQGTLSFWLSAGTNWDGAVGDALQVLIHTDAERSSHQFAVQTQWPRRRLIMPLYDRGELIGGFPAGVACSAPLYTADDAESVLKDGVWYHYLFTWRDGYQAVYLNGALAGFTRNPEIRLRRLGRRLYLGWKKDNGPLFFDPGCEDAARPLAERPWESLLDDVALLRGFVTEREAQLIYREGAPAFAAMPRVEGLLLEAEFYQTTSELVARLLTTSAADVSGRVAVCAENGDQAAEARFALPAGHGGSELVLSLAEAPAGAYTARAIADGGVESEAVAFEKVQPPWLGNTLGAEDIVLPPWTPLEVKEGGASAAAERATVAVSCWGRTYRFDGPLPMSILSQGRELLDAPVAWNFREADQVAPVQWTPPTVVTSSPTRVVLTSEGVMGAFRVAAHTRVEYDGMLWSEFAFRSEAAATNEGMYVEIPLRKEFCVFLQHPARRTCWFPDKNPWTGSFADGGFCLFVGNDDAGLQWFAESDQGWYGSDPKQALSVRRTPGGGVMRIHMVREPVAMPPAFTIAFGLMATPVRPRPPGWRGWGNPTPQRLGRPDIYTPLALDYSWWSIAPGWLLTDRDPSGPHRRFEPPMKWLPFTSTTFMGVRRFGETNLFACLPEWSRFAPEWRNEPVSIRWGKPGGWNEARVNPSSSYRDHYAWMADDLFRRYDVDGLYFDGFAGKQPSLNLRAGFGYVDRDGTLKPTLPILAGRELMRRVYALVRRHRGADGVILVHPATSQIMPVLSFADAIYDGEWMGWSDILASMKTGGMRTGLTDDRLRMLFSYRMFGQVPLVDTRFVQRNLPHDETRLREARKVMGLFLLHDIHGWGSVDGYNAVLTYPLDWWGMAEPSVEFLPYYAAHPPATAGAGSLTSAYVQRSTGRVLVVTLNDSPRTRGSDRLAREGQDGYELRLDLEQLGLREGQFRACDAESLGRLEIPVNGNALPLREMPPGAVKLVALEPMETAR